jgi:hypothetical protein
VFYFMLDVFLSLIFSDDVVLTNVHPLCSLNEQIQEHPFIFQVLVFEGSLHVSLGPLLFPLYSLSKDT